MRCARYANPIAAMNEMIKQQMYLEFVKLCVKKIDEIEIQESVISGTSIT